jgi:hypothetical protein
VPSVTPDEMQKNSIRKALSRCAPISNLKSQISDRATDVRGYRAEGHRMGNSSGFTIPSTIHRPSILPGSSPAIRPATPSLPTCYHHHARRVIRRGRRLEGDAPAAIARVNDASTVSPAPTRRTPLAPRWVCETAASRRQSSIPGTPA